MPATCTRDSISSNYGCYTREIFPNQDALEVYLLAYVLKTMGGTDYTAVLDTTLVSDANTMTCGMTSADRQKAKMYILDQWGGSGNTATQTKAAIKCITNCTKTQLEQMKLYLLCGISGSAT